MSVIKNATSNPGEAVRLLRDSEVNAVSGASDDVGFGTAGCIGPWKLPNGQIVTTQPVGINPWLPGGLEYPG